MKTFAFLSLSLASAFFIASTARAQDGAVANVVITVYSDDNKNLSRDESDSLVPGATVRLVGLPDDKVVDTGITGRDGTYVFQDVPLGRYQFIVTFPSGFTVASEPFTLNTPSQEEVLTINVPVVDRETLPRFTNLRFVNPSSVTGPLSDVSPFAPN